MAKLKEQPMIFDPTHPDFPPEPALPEEIRMALRAGLVGWLRARLEELEGDCLVKPAREGQEEEGILEAVFPALPAGQLVAALAERRIFCTVGEKHALRFTLSAGQSFESLDTVQAILMDVLEIG